MEPANYPPFTSDEALPPRLDGLAAHISVNNPGVRLLLRRVPQLQVTRQRLKPSDTPAVLKAITAVSVALCATPILEVLPSKSEQASIGLQRRGGGTRQRRDHVYQIPLAVVNTVAVGLLISTRRFTPRPV